MKTFVCLATALLLAATAVAAQTISPRQAQIHGTVFDPNGSVIVGAALTFTDNKTKVQSSITTSNEGAFEIALIPGAYEVRVRAPNFAPVIQIVELGEGESRPLNFQLEVQGNYDPVEIVGEGAIPVPASAPSIPETPPPTPGISVIKFVAPVYPQVARTARIRGDVRVLVEIAPDGSAKRVSVLGGHPMLQAAAVEAVMQWRFGCQRCDGELRHVVTITFALLESCDEGASTVVPKVRPNLPNLLTLTEQPRCMSDYPSEIRDSVITKQIGDQILDPAGSWLGSSDRPRVGSPR